MLLLVGAFVLAANPRKAVNWAFASFVGLVGLNYVSGYVTSLLAGGGPPDLFAGPGPGAVLQWPYRHEAIPFAALGTTFLIFDSIALLYFAGLYPDRNALSHPAIVGVGLAVATTFAAVNVADPIAFQNHSAWQNALSLWYSLVYAVALVTLLRRAARADPESIRGRQLRLVAAGCAVAITTRLALVPGELAGAFPLFRTVTSASMLAAVGFLVALWMGVLAYYRREAPARSHAPFERTWRAMSWWVVGIAALWLVKPIVVNVEDALGVETGLRVLAEVTWLSSYAARWLVFAGVVTHALLRYEVFDLDLKLKRAFVVAATLALGGIVFIAAYVALEDALGGTLTATITLAQLASLLLALALLTPLFHLARRFTERLFPGIAAGDAAYLRARKLEVYRAALEPLAREDPLDAARVGDLLSLRRRLGVSPAEHDAILTALRASNEPRRPPGTTRPGDVALGRYRVDALLGSGASGRTFLATDLLEGREVALKEILSDGLDGERAALTAIREAASVAEISHPNVLAVESAQRAGQAFYVVMEHAPGGSLRERLRNGPLDAVAAVRIARGILEGLAAAHARGVVHRDVKPANVLFDADGTPKVADWGVARVPDLSQTLTSIEHGFQPGTPYYMAPEQIEGRAIGVAADQYAVAAMLHEMLTGRPYLEFEGLDLHRVRERILALEPKPVPGASPELNLALARALAKSPESRFPDARAFAVALAQTPEGRGARASVPPGTAAAADAQRPALN